MSRRISVFTLSGAFLLLCAGALWLPPLYAEVIPEEAPPSAPPQIELTIPVETPDTDLPAGIWENPFQAPEPMEVSPKPVLPPTTVRLQSPEEQGYVVVRDKDPGQDVSRVISTAKWYPKTSRAENGHYYAVLAYDAPTYQGLAVYKNTGNPAVTPWSFIVSWYNPSRDIYHADIEVVSSADRAFILYKESGNDIVKCFWFLLSQPDSLGIVTVSSSAPSGAYCSITSDEIEYSGTGVYLYGCFKASEIPAAYFTRSTDMGLTWSPLVVAGDNVSYMMTGNSITYCPGDNHVFILYTDASDVVKVSECSGDFGAGTWTDTTLISSTYARLSCGITSNYGNYILATSHGITSGTDQNILYRYSTDAGTSWSTTYYANYPLTQAYPSCSSNNDGYFNIFFYNGDTTGVYPGMASRRCVYTAMSTYTLGLVDNLHVYNNVISACIEDGATPDHGGSWGDGITSAADAYFGWVGVTPTIDVTVLPVNPPITIPAAGGMFQYRATLRNMTTTAQTFQAWTRWRNPLNVWVNLLGPFSLTLPGSANVTRQRNQNVAGSNPSGTYYFCGYAGSSTAVIYDSSYFTFTKSATDMGGEWVNNNDNWGEDFDVEIEAAPSQFALLGNFPNPFNPTTALSYQLSAYSRVSLRVYDTAGREVAELVKGWREAGAHEVTFDATGLPSGIYLARLQAGELTAVQKLVLLK